MLMSGGEAARVLDRARGRLFGVVGRWPAAQALARRRGLRLCVVGCLSVAAAFAGVALAPLAMLALAPLLLGVPHLASDVRYLLVRRAVITSRARVPLAAAALVCTVAAALGDLQLMAASGLGGVALAAALGDGPTARRAAGSALAAALAAASWAWPRSAALAMAHGHNLVAVALALWLVRRALWAAWLPSLAGAAGVAAIAAGALDGPLGHALAVGSRAASLTAVAVVPPGAPSVVALRLIGLFAFAQAVHYAAWLRLVPDGERDAERPIGFRRSLALLRADFGRATPWLLAACVALPLAACVRFASARGAYFTLAAFHGYLELAFVAALFASRRG